MKTAAKFQHELRFAENPSGCERPHTHDYMVICAVVSGSLTLRLQPEVLELSKGALGVIPAHTTHSVEGFSCDFAGVYALSLFAPQSPPLNWPDRPRIVKPEPGLAAFIGICQQMLPTAFHLQATGGPLAEWIDNFLARHASQTCCSRDRAPWPAQRIKHKIDAESENGGYPRRLIEQLPQSKAHANRIFKKSYGVAIQSYQLCRKAERAKALLNTSLPLSAVAQEAGFYDQGHMTRVFKSIFQITPSVYRRGIRK